MRKLSYVILFLTVFAFSNSLYAKWEKACKKDREMFCEKVEPGEGRIFRCLQEHGSELSKKCNEKVEKRKEEIEQMKQACAGDRNKFCKPGKVAGGNIIECLKEHESDISSDCRAQLDRD